jgi:hypothetical protein
MAPPGKPKDEDYLLGTVDPVSGELEATLLFYGLVDAENQTADYECGPIIYSMLYDTRADSCDVSEVGQNGCVEVDGEYVKPATDRPIEFQGIVVPNEEIGEVPMFYTSTSHLHPPYYPDNTGTQFYA